MLNKKHDPNMSRVPLWKKMNWTVEEAAEYSGIGVSKIKEISNQKNVLLSYGMGQSDGLKENNSRIISKHNIPFERRTS